VTDRRGSRFVLEVVFLAALAAGLAFARLSTLEIGGAMVLGWLVVVVLEWAAWRGEPHFGRGLPPRYYVPQVALPPARPLEQVPASYPDARRDEAPTWIAPAALRAEVLGEWPHAAPAPTERSVLEPMVVLEPEPGPEREPEPEPEPDSWTLVELPPAPLEAPEPAVSSVSGEKRELEPEPAPATTPRTALYHLDPLAEPARRRRLGRRRVEAVGTIEVPPRPTGARPLPPRRGARGSAG
jgi:hypothetical protein